MAVTGRQMTVEELAQMPDDGMCHELIYGELITMSPGGASHGRRTNIFNWSLEEYVMKHGGAAYGAETGYVLARHPDLLLAPDASWMRNPAGPEAEVAGFIRGAPDLVVEVVTSDDHPSKVAAKVAMWLEHGTRMVIVAYPFRRRVRVHRPDRPTVELTGEAIIDGADVMPGWQLSLKRLFG